MTSLKERAKLLDSITNLFVPVLNMDTNYFSSIVDSTARELYCYVSLANTSIYGDSRITAPFKTVEKDIVKLKGGKNGYLVVGVVNISELREQRRENNGKDKKYKPLSANSKREIELFEKEDKSVKMDLTDLI